MHCHPPPLHPTTQSAYEIFLKIKDEYGMWICPNGGSMKDSVFRVGHIGYLKKEDYDMLIAADEELRGGYLRWDWQAGGAMQNVECVAYGETFC